MKPRVIFTALAQAVFLTLPAVAAEPTVASSPSPEATSLARGPFESDWKSLQRYRAPDWFRDAKFGIWAHWGPQVVPRQGGGWYSRSMTRKARRLQYHMPTMATPRSLATRTSFPSGKPKNGIPIS